MGTPRDAHLVAVHVEGLAELQRLRDAMDADDLGFTEQFHQVFDAAVDFYRAAIPLRALLLTDHDLGNAYRDVAGTTGLGPQLPVAEVAAWLRAACRAGRVDRAIDARAIAIMLCGSADYLATLDLMLDDAVASSTYGDRRRIAASLLPLVVGDTATTGSAEHADPAEDASSGPDPPIIPGRWAGPRPE